MSPAESNGSGSGEGLGKRQYDDEERASTPAGMEKRGRFDGGSDQTPAEETDASASASATPQDPASRHHNHPFDSTEYSSRSESHRGPEHYGRMADSYGRLDMYGRMDPHSREGSYGRSGDSGYSRSESYGRIDPYGMSKSGYERGRYEHYRSDRDRERERYYEYYRERDYDREFRSHREPRERIYNQPPPSPRRRSRDSSPAAPTRRELSPSPATQQGIWSKEASRPTSPAKEGSTQQPDSGIAMQADASEAIPLGPRVPETLSEQAAISRTGTVSTSTTPPVSAAAAAVQSLVLGEDAIVRSPSVVASRNNSPPTQAAPTPLRNYSLPANLQSTGSASVLSSTDHSTPPVALGPPSSQQSNGYHYRTNSGHGDYLHSRYGSHSGSYSNSQYYRQSSNYPAYSKPHYHRSSSSRAYPSSGPYPPSIELPPNWSKASDPEGRIYYYNEITRATQWDPPRVESPAEVLSEPTPTAPLSHYGPTVSAHTYRTPQSHHQQPISTARVPSPEPPKPVNIDGFTQEQLQEVIGRAYDKQKQKHLANGSGSAGASVHDVDSPSARLTNPHSPSAMRLSSGGKPLKPMNEKDLKAAVGFFDVFVPLGHWCCRSLNFDKLFHIDNVLFLLLPH